MELAKRQETYPFVYLLPACAMANRYDFTTSVVRLFKTDRQAENLYNGRVSLFSSVDDLKKVDPDFLKQVFEDLCKENGLDPASYSGDPAHRLYRVCYEVGDYVKTAGLVLSGKQVQRHLYEFNNKKIAEKVETWRYPRQARIILKAVLATGTAHHTEDDLQKLMLNLIATGQLKTKQDHWRIFQYYRPQYINDGFLIRGGGEFDTPEVDDVEASNT